MAHSHFADILYIETVPSVFIYTQLAPIPISVFDALESILVFNRGNPLVSPAFILRKKAEKDLSSLRSSCCKLEAFGFPSVSVSVCHTSLKCAHCSL
jgi:hypothetical protein